MQSRMLGIRIDMDHDADGSETHAKRLANETYAALQEHPPLCCDCSLISVTFEGIDRNLRGRLSVTIPAVAYVEEVAQLLARTWMTYIHERWGHRATVEITMAGADPAPVGTVRVITAAGYHFIFSRVAQEISFEEQHRALHEYRQKVIGIMRKD